MSAVDLDEGAGLGDQSTMSDLKPWGELDLAPDSVTELSIGALHLAVKRVRGEVWLLTERDDRPREGDGEWQRWAVPDGTVVRLRPSVPDRLLVVSHEHPFHLPGRGKARVYVRIPLFVQVVLSGPGMTELLVLDEPSMVLSDTWWGTIQEGELAYWLSTRARSEVSPDLFVPHIAMCPVHLENESGEALPVDKFAVRGLHLSLFRHEERVWTDELSVRYLEAGEASEIRFGGTPPKEEPRGVRLAEPRMPIRRGLQARTFDRLRSLAVLGG
jgi:hypothetical protein